MSRAHPRTARRPDAEHADARPAAGSPGRFVFVREFLRSPAELGTCFSSSRALSRAMVECADVASARCVVEYGPGTGPVTAEILSGIDHVSPEVPPHQRRPGQTVFFAIESNEGLAAALRARWPGLAVYQEDAANVRSLCERVGVRPGEVDCVVSALPFLLFPPQLQTDILRQTASILSPGGRFTTLTYGIEVLMPRVRRFRKQMERAFPDVTLSRVVLANFPPAFVYTCRV